MAYIFNVSGNSVNLVTSLAKVIILCISRYIPHTISQVAALSIYCGRFVYIHFSAVTRRDAPTLHAFYDGEVCELCYSPFSEED